MGRKKRSSRILDRANVRAAGLRAIGSLDFGNGLTSDSFEQAITDVRTKLDDYNQTLSTVDEKANHLSESEMILRDYHERVLSGVGAKYGKNSNEYEMVGGKRKSERKRPASRKKDPKSSN